jgi:hypothetical protein
MDEPPPRPGDPSNPTGTTLLAAGMLTRLEKMARSVGLDNIAYFVSMGKSEADLILRASREGRSENGSGRADEGRPDRRGRRGSAPRPSAPPRPTLG